MAQATKTQKAGWRMVIAGWYIYTNEAGKELAYVERYRSFWNVYIYPKGDASRQRMLKESPKTLREAKELAQREYIAATKTELKRDAEAAEIVRNAGVAEGVTTPIAEEIAAPAASAPAMKVYQRTENGTTTTVTQKAGMAEINHAMMGGRREVKTMSSITSTDYAITYRDGRDVRLVLTEVAEDMVLTPATEDEAIALRAERQAARREAAKAPVEPQAEEPERALLHRRQDGNHVYGPVVTVFGKRYVIDGPLSVNGWVNYFSVRGGERFGPVRDSGPHARPGTVGYAIGIVARRLVGRD